MSTHPRDWPLHFCRALKKIEFYYLGAGHNRGRGVKPEIVGAFDALWAWVIDDDLDRRRQHEVDQRYALNRTARLERGALALCRGELIDLIPDAPEDVLSPCTKACEACLATVSDILDVTEALDE